MIRIAQLYKNAFDRLEPATWWLSLVMFVNRSGTMVVPFMTLYLTQSRHFTIGQAGVVLSIYGAGAVCGTFLGGKLVDKIGFHVVQLFALIGGGILFMILGQIASYPYICFFVFLLSIINESFRPANYAAIAHYSREDNRTRSLSLNRLAINMGWALGGAFGGFILAKNVHLLFWVDGITNILAAVLLHFVLSPYHPQIFKLKKTDETADKNSSVYKDKSFLLLILFTLLFAFCFWQLFTTQPVFYREILHLSFPFIGFLMAMNGAIIGVFEMLVVFHLENKRALLHYVSIGVALTGLSFFILDILPRNQWLALISMITVTTGEMLTMSFLSAYWMGRTTPFNRGQYASLYTSGWSVAQVLGPGIGALIAQHYGFTSLWGITGTICIVSALGYRGLLWKESAV